MKIAITTFYTTSYQPLADITTTELKKYADRHGYDLFVNVIPDGNVDYVKTVDARKLLDEYDLVWAVENDLLITNHTIRIESFIDDEHDFFICCDINGENGGSFIIKNTDWGKNWLEYTNNLCGEYATEQNVWEKLAIEGKNIKYLNHPSINSIPYEYYAPSFGYINWEQYEPRKEKPTHEMGNWEVGDFICHLPGKNLHERLRIFNELKENIIYE